MGEGVHVLRAALLRYFYAHFQLAYSEVRKVTLDVLENNPGACHCYKAAGFA